MIILIYISVLLRLLINIFSQLFYNINYIEYNRGIKYYSSTKESDKTPQVLQASGPSGHLVKIDPYFITGLTEAEGNFSIRKNLDSRARYGLTVGLRFKITMLDNELTLLKQVQSYFGVGKIYISDKGVVDYLVQDKEGLKVIVNHFNKYPLRGTKYQDFLDFAKVLEMILNRNHNTYEGKMTIIDISNNMNKYRKEFYIPNHTIKDDSNYMPINGHYINGFIAGDGSLFLKTKLNFGSMGIQISQHRNNAPLMKEIAEYFSPTIPVVFHSENAVQITISGDKLWKDVIFVHFSRYPLHGSKLIQLEKLNEIALFKQSGKHLIKEGRTRVFSQKAEYYILSIWNR